MINKFINFEQNDSYVTKKCYYSTLQNLCYFISTLVQEFGQKKGRRIYEQQDRMQVEAENLEKKLSKAVETVSKDDLVVPKDPTQGSKTIENLIPPCNRYRRFHREEKV